MNKLPTPTNLKEIPDYFCGHLIYHVNEEGCPFIVYDGNERHLFTSRQQAEKFCMENSYQLNDEDIARLMLTMQRIINAYTTLDVVAKVIKREHGLIMQGWALDLRKVADKLDTFISQHYTKSK